MEGEGIEIINSNIFILKVIFRQGFVNTLKLVPVAILFSMIVGTIGGIIRVFRLPIIDNILKVYISLNRGVPFLVILFLTYYVLPSGRDPFIASTIALTICHGAYLIEIVRGGLESVDKGQSDAAKSLGLSTWQTIFLIILPQAVSVMTPAVIGQLILLIKDTALTSIIGNTELTRTGRSLMQTVTKPIEIFLFVAIYYFIICHTLKLAENYIKQRIKFNI